MPNSLFKVNRIPNTNFLQGGTGAVSRSVRDKLRDVISAADFDYAIGATAAVNAAAINAAIVYAMPLGRVVVIPGVPATVGALAALPTSGTLRIHFEDGAVLSAPGAGIAATSDITLMSPTTSTEFTGNARFRYYRRVFNMDAITIGTTHSARGLFTFQHCGRTYNYTGAADRIDFTPAYGCKSAVAATVASINIQGFRFEDLGGLVCDFGFVWSSGFDECKIDDVSCDAMGRMMIYVGSQANWAVCNNIIISRIVGRNIYPRSAPTAETECHMVLGYGRRIDLDGFVGDTIYDTHATTHDTEAVYFKGLAINVTNGHLKDAARGDAYMALKGTTPTTAELLDLEALGGATPYLAIAHVENVTCIATPAFVAAYGLASGTFVSGTRVHWENIDIIGDWDRGLNTSGAGSVKGVRVKGNCVYGVLATGDVNDPESFYFEDVKVEGEMSSGGIEYRLASHASLSLSVPEVVFDNCHVKATGAIAAWTGGITVRCDKSAGQNTIGLVKRVNCSVIDAKSAGHGGAFVVRTDLDTGANQGIVSRVVDDNWSQDGNDWIVHYAGTGIAFAMFGDGITGTIASVDVNGITIPTVFRMGKYLGTSSSVFSGVGTVAAGATTAVITPGFISSQTNLSALDQIRITPGDMGAATKWWISAASGNTFQMNVDIAPGGAGFSFGWRAVNRFFK